MVLIVKKAPINSHEEVEERYPSIKRQLGNLSSRKLAIRVPKLDNSLVLGSSEFVRKHTVVTSILNVVFVRLCVFQVDRFGENQVLGQFGGVGREDELSNVVRFAESGLDVLFLTYSSFLSTTLALFKMVPVQRIHTCVASGVGYTPIKSSSFHSKTTRLTVGSSSPV